MLVSPYREMREFDWSKPCHLTSICFYARQDASAAAHTSRVKCEEMAGNRPGQPANRNYYRLSRVS